MDRTAGGLGYPPGWVSPQASGEGEVMSHLPVPPLATLYADPPSDGIPTVSVAREAGEFSRPNIDGRQPTDGLLSASVRLSTHRPDKLAIPASPDRRSSADGEDPRSPMSGKFVSRRPSKLAITKLAIPTGAGRVDWLRLGLRLCEKLGRGSYATVYRVDRPLADPSDLFEGSGSVAAKVTLTQGEAQRKLQARREYELLRQVAHPNIVRAHRFEEAELEVAMITDYVAGGTLAACVRSGGALPLAWAQHVASGLLGAVAHLHGQRVFHLDVNPGNVLLRASDGAPILCDFGSAQRAREEGCLGAAATPLYAAPEAVASRALSGDLLDVWGAGCCIFEAAVGAVPWSSDTEPDVVGTEAFVRRLESFAAVEIPAIRRAEKEPDREELPETCWALLQRCLAPFKQRATALEALESPWVEAFVLPHAPTAEELRRRRHNPYVGTVFHAPASPSIFSLDPRSPGSSAVRPRGLPGTLQDRGEDLAPSCPASVSTAMSSSAPSWGDNVGGARASDPYSPAEAHRGVAREAGPRRSGELPAPTGPRASTDRGAGPASPTEEQRSAPADAGGYPPGSAPVTPPLACLRRGPGGAGPGDDFGGARPGVLPWNGLDQSPVSLHSDEASTVHRIAISSFPASRFPADPAAPEPDPALAGTDAPRAASRSPSRSRVPYAGDPHSPTEGRRRRSCPSLTTQ